MQMQIHAKKKLEGQISRCTKSSAWINVGNSKGNSPKIYNLTDPVPLTFDLKINRL